jgi:hypothetical protein
MLSRISTASKGEPGLLSAADKVSLEAKRDEEDRQQNQMHPKCFYNCHFTTTRSLLGGLIQLQK